MRVLKRVSRKDLLFAAWIVLLLAAIGNAALAALRVFRRVLLCCSPGSLDQPLCQLIERRAGQGHVEVFGAGGVRRNKRQVDHPASINEFRPAPGLPATKIPSAFSSRRWFKRDERPYSSNDIRFNGRTAVISFLANLFGKEES